MAHVTYIGLNFGTFNDELAASTISNQAGTGNYRWTQATDAYGDAHKTLAYRFTLTQPTNDKRKRASLENRVLNGALGRPRTHDPVVRSLLTLLGYLTCKSDTYIESHCTINLLPRPVST
jgi:hypothetical protein